VEERHRYGSPILQGVCYIVMSAVVESWLRGLEVLSPRVGVSVYAVLDIGSLRLTSFRYWSRPYHEKPWNYCERAVRSLAYS
jgi:hypothetical protein